jgi:hypothetical protein
LIWSGFSGLSFQLGCGGSGLVWFGLVSCYSLIIEDISLIRETSHCNVFLFVPIFHFFTHLVIVVVCMYIVDFTLKIV